MLREFDARGLVVKNAGHKNHNTRKGHDDEGCSHTEDGDKALFHRVLNLRYGVRVGRRTHTGFIRKEPAGHTELHRFGNRETQSAAGDSLGIKGRFDDEFKGRNNLRGVHADHPRAAHDVNGSHGGNDLFRDAARYHRRRRNRKARQPQRP